MNIFSNIDFIEFIDLLGTFVFAISGIRLASRKDIDWFGAYVIGLVTAIGGGTTRDVLLGVTPFWMIDVKYLSVTGIALLSIIIFKNRMFLWRKTLFLFDTIGLGLFTVTGISKSAELGLPIWASITMGVITGSVGGVIRDIIINEVPLLFRKDIYAIPSIIGGMVYFACYYFEFAIPVPELIAASVVIAIRLVSVKFKWHLPQLKPLEDD